MPALRAGILGCGGFAHRHIETILGLPAEVQLAALCDRHAERAAALAAKYQPGTPIYTAHAEMLAQAGLDVLIVCLPPYGHTDEVMQAAARGVHVLIEKPIALTSAHAWQMVAAAEASGIKTQVGFDLRFGGAIRALKDKITSGAAGPVGLMSTRYFCNSLERDWWRDREKSGGQVVEQVIHMFDLLRYLVGDEPRSVYSLQANLFHGDVPGYTIEDTSATLIQFSHGAIGVVYASNNAVPGQWINDYRVVTQNITAEFADGNHAHFTYTRQPGLPVETIAAADDFYVLQTQDLLRAIRTGGATVTPIREGAKSLDLALAARRSAETQALVLLEPPPSA